MRCALYACICCAMSAYMLSPRVLFCLFSDTGRTYPKEHCTVQPRPCAHSTPESGTSQQQTLQSILGSRVAALELTDAGVSVLLEAGGAHAPPDGHQPLALGAAVHLGRVALLGVVHAAATHLHQRRGVGARHHVGEHGQVAADAHAALVVDAHGGERDAGADVLEGQVEAPPAQRTHPPHLHTIRLVSGPGRPGFKNRRHAQLPIFPRMHCIAREGMEAGWRLRSFVLFAGWTSFKKTLWLLI